MSSMLALQSEETALTKTSSMLIALQYGSTKLARKLAACWYFRMAYQQLHAGIPTTCWYTFPNTVTTCWYTLWRYGAKTCQLTSSILILHCKQTALARIGSMLMTLHYSFIVLAGVSSILKAHHFEFQPLLEIPAYWWSFIMVIWAPSITCRTCWHSNYITLICT